MDKLVLPIAADEESPNVEELEDVEEQQQRREEIQGHLAGAIGEYRYDAESTLNSSLASNVGPAALNPYLWDGEHEGHVKMQMPTKGSDASIVKDTQMATIAQSHNEELQKLRVELVETRAAFDNEVATLRMSKAQSDLSLLKAQELLEEKTSEIIELNNRLEEMVKINVAIEKEVIQLQNENMELINMEPEEDIGIGEYEQELAVYIHGLEEALRKMKEEEKENKAKYEKHYEDFQKQMKSQEQDIGQYKERYQKESSFLNELANLFLPLLENPHPTELITAKDTTFWDAVKVNYAAIKSENLELKDRLTKSQAELNAAKIRMKLLCDQFEKRMAIGGARSAVDRRTVDQESQVDHEDPVIPTNDISVQTEYCDDRQAAAEDIAEELLKAPNHVINDIKEKSEQSCGETECEFCPVYKQELVEMLTKRDDDKRSFREIIYNWRLQFTKLENIAVEKSQLKDLLAETVRKLDLMEKENARLKEMYEIAFSVSNQYMLTRYSVCQEYLLQKVSSMSRILEDGDKLVQTMNLGEDVESESIGVAATGSRLLVRRKEQPKGKGKGAIPKVSKSKPKVERDSSST